METAYKALAKAQAAMGPALKTATNPHFKKKYADLGAVQEACFDPLRANGFAVYQPVGRDEAGAFVKTVFAHESGEILECTVPLLVNKNDMQGLGSAITYARRYGLMSMAGIAPEDDDGNASVKPGDKTDRTKSKEPPKVDDLIVSGENARDFANKVIARFKGKGGLVAAQVLQANQKWIAGLPDDMRAEIEHASGVEGAKPRAVA